MQYDISKQVKSSFSDTLNAVTNELKKEGFGIISEIDLTAKFREKLNIDFRNYRILGACNPEFAHRAIGMEDKIGLMLPCNILVQEHANGSVEVSAINPLQSIGNIGNPELAELADDVTDRLKKVIENV
jgi:uncharacterized protein (DUF302 family)